MPEANRCDGGGASEGEQQGVPHRTPAEPAHCQGKNNHPLSLELQKEWVSYLLVHLSLFSEANDNL